VADQVQGVHVVQPLGVSTWTPAPGPLRGKLADETGYPLRPHVLRQAAPGCLVILTRALRVPVLTATRGQQRSLQSSVMRYPRVRIFVVRTMIHPRSSKLGPERDRPRDVHARRPGDQPRPG